MSHFTSIKVQFKNKEILKDVLVAQGHEVLENTYVRGYQGNRTRADLVVRRSNGYDIGFRQQGDSLEMVADFWGLGISAESFLAPIRQEYTRRQLLATAAEKGFTVESESVDEQGQIKIVLGRWA
ncbi:DUF1257 domain-containing protein [Thermostichus sp. MS-CIW-34]